MNLIFTGKSLSEALIFASANPQYDNRLFMNLPVQYMKIPSSEHGENIERTWGEHDVHTNCFFVLTFRPIYVHNMFSTCSEIAIFMYWTHNLMHNLLSYCGLADAKISASEKDLPVH